MIYVTVKQSPMYRQMSLEDLLFGPDRSTLINPNTTNTRTYEVMTVSENFNRRFNILELIAILKDFNDKTEHLRNKPREELYRTFFIPKSSGGMRRIDAPQPELMDSLRDLKRIFENDFQALYHTSAFAYVKKRNTLSAVKRHQSNESKWFGKYDISNFFGSTTLDFVMKMFAMVFPFSEVISYKSGEHELRKALELAFLNGGLPQGTPISPLITNIMMIPLDFRIFNGLKSFKNQYFVYTRYADDFLISSRFTFDPKEIEKYIVDTLAEVEAPFKLKPEKTRYGSSSGSNWNLGLMLNKDNEITIGSKRTRQFQTMVTSYVKDRKNGIMWSRSDIQVLDGYRNYYHMIEPEKIDGILAHIGQKLGIDIRKAIHEDLKT